MAQKHAHQPTDIDEVILVFKTHLDIGFTDSAANVKRSYFNDFLPKAIETARWFRRREDSLEYVWTVGSWLVYEYLETASPAGRRMIEDAIDRGEIAWHAMPFTFHTELLDADLLKAGLRMSQELDRRFGCETIAAKMTDVPGHTRGLVGLLADAGVEFLHIGVNPACTVPDVPALFIWQDQTGRKLTAAWQKDYGQLLTVDGQRFAMHVDVTGDNLGPHEPGGAMGVYARVRNAYPYAKITAGTLNDFAQCLGKAKGLDLPVITQEIGDTWIHGIGTDPAKVAQFRELSRLRKTWGPSKAPDKVNAFDRYLLQIAEHTWGKNEMVWLADYKNYSPKQLARLRKTTHCKDFEASWTEQRKLITEAVESLSHKGQQAQARAALHYLPPKRKDLSKYQPLKAASRLVLTRFEVEVNPADGSVGYLKVNSTGKAWFKGNRRLGGFAYQTFSNADYEQYIKQYLRQQPFWAIEDNSKPGLADHSISAWWQPSQTKAYYKDVGNVEMILVELSMPRQCVKDYGCPSNLTIQYAFAKDGYRIGVELQWFDKKANRMPEAMWLSFMPQISNASGWEMDKLGCWVSPLDVIHNGNRKLHAVNECVKYEGDDGSLVIRSLDCPLVAPGNPSLLNFNNRKPSMQKGMHFNLYNNIWGTNFPMWFDGDMRFRFEVDFE